MITSRQQISLELEVVKWLLLVALAIALVMALATALAAAEPMIGIEPARLPEDMGRLARPLETAPIRPYFPEEGPEIQLPAAEVAARLWMVLEHQRAGCVAEALAGWGQIRLSGTREVWRKTAMGAAYLGAGDVDRAALQLDAARQIAPAHPVVAYYTGILRLEQAARAARVPDEMSGGNERMVAHVPLLGRQARTTFNMLARQELELAIAGAGDVRLDEPLVTNGRELEEQIVVPRVGDLLVALGADNFVGRAHHLLFGLALDEGELRVAELHLDQAVATGIAPLFGYEDLAEAYLSEQRPTDALRAAGKYLAANYPLLWKIGQEAKATMDRPWSGWLW
jgi:hypothetical protein